MCVLVGAYNVVCGMYVCTCLLYVCKHHRMCVMRNQHTLQI